MQILTIGSLTADHFFLPRRESFVEVYGKKNWQILLGDKIKIEKYFEFFGGGGANIAVGLSRLGISSAVFGSIGDDSFSKNILENLQQENVNKNFIHQEINEKSSFSFILKSKSNERTVFHFPGIAEKSANFDPKILQNFSGLCLQHLSANNSEEIFSEIENYFVVNPGKFLSWNPGRESLEKGISKFRKFLSVVDILLLNLEEAQIFTEKKTERDIFKNIFESNFSGITIITNSNKGSIGCDGKKIVSCPICEDFPKNDTLGAGDGFLTGAVFASLQNFDLQKILKFGTISAGAVVAKIGAQTGLQTKMEIEKLADEIDLDFQITDL